MTRKTFDTVSIIQILMLLILISNYYLGYDSLILKEMNKDIIPKILIALNIILLIVIYFLMAEIGLKDINVYCNLLNENKFN